MEPLTQMLLQVHQIEQCDACRSFQLNQEIQIAVRTLVATCIGAKDTDRFDTVSFGQMRLFSLQCACDIDQSCHFPPS